MDIEVYILMFPLHVRAIFSVPTSSNRLRLGPLTPSLLPMANEQFSMYWSPHHLWGARGQGEQAEWAECYTRSFLGPQEAPRSLPLLPDHPWIPGTFLRPQKAPSSPPLLPAHSQSIPGSLEPSWSLKKPPACSLGPWSELGVSQMLYWVPETFLEPQEAPSLLPLLPRASLGPWSKLGASWSKLERDKDRTTITRVIQPFCKKKSKKKYKIV